MKNFTIEEYPIIFDEPQRIKSGAHWTAHIPFAFFLIDLLKPEVLVELGVAEGDSYNAFCQAVKKLQLPASCYGVDTWQEEAVSGGEKNFQELRYYQEKKYSSISTLIRNNVDEASQSFPLNSVDLLHIRTGGTYEAVKHHFETWLPKMKDSGVVIFHATQNPDHGGTGKVWKELSGKYSSYEFTNGSGLGILLTGTNQKLQTFFNDLRNDSFLQKLFYLLGQRLLLNEERSSTALKKQEVMESTEYRINREISALNKEGEGNSLQMQLDLYKKELGTVLQQLINTEEKLKLSNVELTKFHEMVEYMRLKNRLKRAGKLVIPKSARSLLRKAYNLLLEKNSETYTYSIHTNADDILAEISRFEKSPLISIIVPVYNVDPVWLEKAINSVKKQYYTNWELCLVDDASTNEKTRKFLASVQHNKIKIKFLDKNVNISAASNEALKLSSGEYIALLDNDDELTQDALYEVVKAINNTGADFIYSDEDKIDMRNKFVDPNFKPDFSLDMLLSQNYICHFTVISKQLITSVGGFEVGLEGSQDHDLFLKCIEKSNKIHHISKVLYHWRMIPGSTASKFDSKSYAQTAGRKAVSNYLKRNDIKAIVLDGADAGTYRVKRELTGNPLVSIMIPFKDKPELLKICIDSILSKSTYKNFEIIGISNNSTALSSFDLMDRYEKMDSRIRFYQYNVPFNFSQLNNYAASIAKGEQLILLNNDIEIITPDWIEALLEHSQRPEVGAVGAKLYYPDDTIQHAGVIIGMGGIAGHGHKHYKREEKGYHSRLVLIQNYSAVTAACLMVKKRCYEEIQGLDEKNLCVAFNDVDFCLRLREKGYLNIYTPYCECYHHESISRGYEDTYSKRKRFQSETEYMGKRHEKILGEGDPYYNSNLTLEHEDFSLKK